MGKDSKSQLLRLGLIVAIFFAAKPASPVPILWGVDEQDGGLFSIADYTQVGVSAAAAGYVNYGPLVFDDGVTLVPVGQHIEAFGLDFNGVAFMAVNNDVGAVAEPVLLSFDTNNVLAGLEATVVGRIDVVFDDDNDNVTGLAIDPVSGDLYGLFRDDDEDTVDKLVLIDKTTGNVTILGDIEGSGEDVREGEDLVFDRVGNLFVTDDDSDKLLRVSKVDGSILEIVDNNQQGGLAVSSLKIEALAWDFDNDRMISFDDRNDLFVLLSLENGNNTSLGNALGLRDIEGIGFVPTSVIPEPGTVLLLGLGVLALGVGGRATRARIQGAPREKE